MDNRGYVIIHNDFINVSNKTPTVEGFHVTQKVCLVVFPFRIISRFTYRSK